MQDESPHTLSDTLSRLMARDQTNQSELAKDCNLPVNTVQRLCSGETTDPRLSTLRPLANHFGISISQLVGDYPTPGVSKNYRGELHVPYPKNHETVSLYRDINRFDESGRITPHIVMGIRSLLRSVLAIAGDSA